MSGGKKSWTDVFPLFATWFPHFTVWGSLINNTLAISLMALANQLYVHLRLESSDAKLKWYDYIVSFLLTLATGLVVYACIYALFGYLPMGLHSKK